MPPSTPASARRPRLDPGPPRPHEPRDRPPGRRRPQPGPGHQSVVRPSRPTGRRQPVAGPELDGGPVTATTVTIPPAKTVRSFQAAADRRDPGGAAAARRSRGPAARAAPAPHPPPRPRRPRHREGPTLGPRRSPARTARRGGRRAGPIVVGDPPRGGGVPHRQDLRRLVSRRPAQCRPRPSKRYARWNGSGAGRTSSSAGPSGTGKTFLLEALGQAAVEAGMKVAWFTLEQLGVLVGRHRADDLSARPSPASYAPNS